LANLAADTGAGRYLPKQAITGNGISIHYAIYGHGSPVILLHGGSPILIIGAIRSKPWRRIIASSALITAVMAARHATQGLTITI
jgi:hypothetical protein